MSKLRPVDISDYYNLCIRYALRRLGSKLRVSEFLQLQREVYHRDELYQPGTILIWNVKDESENIPYYIMENGVIITARICKNIHVGILENPQTCDGTRVEDVFSELTYFTTDIRSPYVQCRRLGLLTTLPDTIVRADTIEKREKEIYGY